MDPEHLDPYALTALGIYLGALLLLALVPTALYLARRGGAYGRLRTALGQARGAGRAVFAPLPPKSGGEFLVYAQGRLAARVGAQDGLGADLDQVKRIALVKDMDGQTGLVVTVAGKDVCVTGLEEMARVWGAVQQDDAPVSFVFRDDESQRMKTLMGRLSYQEQQLLGQWLSEKEVLTDIIPGVDYEGTIVSGGTKAGATLVVTNLRAGLLATTIAGNARHYNLVSYLLPLAEKVTLERKPKLSGKTSYLLRLELPAELAGKGPVPPTLKLTADHTGVLLPIVLFKRPLEVVDPPLGPGRLVASWIAAAIGWGILVGGLGVAAAAGLGEAERIYQRFFLAIVAGAFLTPAILRAFTLYEVYFERTRQQSARGELTA